MADARPTIADKRRAFRALHEAGCFVIPNPWDVGSARFLQGPASRRLPPPVPASPGRRAGPMAPFRVTRC